MLSEGELHVQAMRLVCEALADREKTGLEVDWDVINQQLDHMDVILQGIADQRSDDAEQIETLRREREAAYERISTVRDEVAAEIESLRKDRDHWKAARQDAIEAGELMQAEIETLRQQLGAARAETVEVRRRLAEEINRHNATHCEKIELFQQKESANQHAAEQQQDTEIWRQRFDWAQNEVKYLRDRLDEERSVSAGLRQKLTAAEAAVSLQRAGIERLRAFVGKVRSVVDNDCDGLEIEEMIQALAELDETNSEATLNSSVVTDSLTPAAEGGE